MNSRRAARCAALFFIALALACDRAPLPQPPPDAAGNRGPLLEAPALLELARKHFHLRGCMDVAADIVKEAGPRSMSCTGGNAFPATACMDRALRRREPFVHLRSGFGTDSFLSSAVVGTPGGAVVFYFTDSMGPAYKGTCLRQNVLSALAGDPICKRQLTDRVDLRTCAPYEEKHRPMYEEPWAAGCDTHAPALYAGRVIHRVPLVSDPKKWSLHCEQLSVNAVAIVEEDGSVQCARVISATKRDRPPPAGLYDEIRKNLMQWRFSPPAVYGQPLTVQWPIYEERPCAREK